MANPTVKHWQDPVNLILGLWLLGSPWVLKYQAETTPMWSAVALGALVAAIAALALFKVGAWQEWVNLALGVCILISPWIPSNPLAAATLNAVVVGGGVAVLAAWVLATDKDIGGWWSPAT